MSRSTRNLLLFALLLGAVYSYFFSDWFKTKSIRIFAQNRSLPGAAAEGATTAPVTFAFEAPISLTRLQVLKLDPQTKAKTATAVWQVETKTNSAPVRGFVYGSHIQGMSAPKECPTAEPLLPNTPYVLVVDAGKIHSEVQFTPVAPEPAVQ